MRKGFIESRETLTSRELGIYEEVSPLRKTLSWGPVGTEAILASMLDPDVSLYVGVVDVLPAREQYLNFEKLLVNKGCEVVRVRDLLAWELKNDSSPLPAKDLADLELKIIQKSKQLIKKYGTVNDGNLFQIRPLLEADAFEYGEEIAIRLNSIICQTESEDLPLGNLLFGRDQSNVIGDTIFWSKMSKRIREPEVELWKFALKDYLREENQFEVTGSGRLEGGDAIFHKNDCLVGVGGRSNMEGVLQIAPHIFEQGLDVYAIWHPRRDSGEVEHQTTMHLDTFYMPAPKNTCVVLMDEAKDRSVVQILGKNQSKNSLVVSSFADYLINSGADIIPLTIDQQLGYQANFVVIDENSVLVTTHDDYLRNEFEKRGIEVIDGNLEAITKGYGGAHCSLTPLIRK